MSSVGAERMSTFVGSDNHWRVVRAPYGARSWYIFRRHWDRWELTGCGHPSQNAAMTRAHDLAGWRRG